MQKMTKEWYSQNGYRVSPNIDQALIDRAERDVLDAYVRPILPDADPSGDDGVARCVADLAFLLLLQRSLFVTRAGAKEKTGSSMNAGEWAILAEGATTAAASLKRLRAHSGAVEGAKVTDICKIFFSSNFLHS